MIEATIEEWKHRARLAEAEARELRKKLLAAQTEALKNHQKVERMEAAIRIAEGLLPAKDGV